MPTETDIRLRSWLDANQRDREQMCRSVLALDPHYSDVRPRHPKGGPDGGRDIEAIFDGDRIAYGAVGFHNGANDADGQKKKIRAKFSSDLASAFRAKPDLKVFVFLTNLHFTMAEHDEMRVEARAAGIEHCDVMDRERIRIELDQPAGFFIRFQYLGIPLSEAEQASFLALYGDRIQQVVSTGFQRIERTLSRILFLQEAADVLIGIGVTFHLKRSYPAAEIGHFRAFVDIGLRAIKVGIVSIWFGSSDRPHRFWDGHEKNEAAGIAHGISSGRWEQKLNPNDPSEVELVEAGGGTQRGIDPVPSVFVHYSHDDPLLRYQPRLQLRDLDDCFFMPVLNRSLAEKVRSIEVFANGYKLAHIDDGEFMIDDSPFEVPLPAVFSQDELTDPWVRIRPSKISSAFQLRFSSVTPKRMFGYEEIRESS